MMPTKNVDNGYFLQATAHQTGAVGVFHVYANDDRLAEIIDIGLREKSGKALYDSGIEDRSLRYGWLFSRTGETLDEVLIAKPMPDMRVIMCHGGQFICQGIAAFLIEYCFQEIATDNALPRDFDPEMVEPLLDHMLAACYTETQAAALLSAREKLRATGEFTIPLHVLSPLHLCLTGPPNAGKSSLLNRLTGFDRAFVHAEAGATRDAVGEFAEIAGYGVLLEDLPGFASGDNGIIGEAIDKAKLRLELADVVAFVCDSAAGWDAETDQAAQWLRDILADSNNNEKLKKPVIVVLNKSDLTSTITGRPWSRYFPDPVLVATSSLPDSDAAEKFASAFFQIMERNKIGSIE